MFSLIITIISIALVALLAVATVYYGGSAFSQGSAKAEAATIVSQAQQIAAAEVLYANDNSGTFDTSPGLTGLTASPYYLSAVPTPPKDASGSWGAVDNGTGIQVTLTVTSKTICDDINSQVNPTGAATPQAQCTWTSGTTSSGSFTYND